VDGENPLHPTKVLRRELAHILLRSLEDKKWRGTWRIKKFISDSLIPKKPKGPVICSTKYGFEVIVHPTLDSNWGVEIQIYYEGSYEAGTLYVFSQTLSAGDVCLDVGANIGLMSLYAAKLVGKSGLVYSFEPMPAVFELLRANVHLTRFSNIHAYKLALGSRQGTQPIYAHFDVNRGGSSLVDFEGGQKIADVNVETIDNFVSSFAKKDIKLIKIDVEGWELEVLKGARGILSQANAPVICIEYSDSHPIQGGVPLDIYRFITSINRYRCFKLEKGKSALSKLVAIREIGDLPKQDNLFCFLPFHMEALDEELFNDP
jgi:FkbM family methyltransferase